MLDLQPIKARLAAATPGPWKASHNSKPLNKAAVAEVNTTFILPDTPMLSSPHKDADLIANAPTDLAALVAEVERLENEAAVMQQVTLAGLAAEVERLRLAIAEHRKTVEPGDDYCGADIVLWRALDA